MLGSSSLMATPTEADLSNDLQDDVARYFQTVNLDSKGNIFKQVSEADPTDLPVVTGLKTAEVSKDREGVTLRLRRVIDLVTDLERERVAKRYPVQEIHAKPDGSLRAVAKPMPDEAPVTRTTASRIATAAAYHRRRRAERNEP